MAEPVRRQENPSGTRSWFVDIVAVVSFVLVALVPGTEPVPRSGIGAHTGRII